MAAVVNAVDQCCRQTEPASPSKSIIWRIELIRWCVCWVMLIDYSSLTQCF